MANWLLDAGHGGSDVGATYNGRHEAQDVLRLTKRVGEILVANGEKVSYTRTTDKFVSLADRTAMENRGNYDYFFSIHRNDAKDKNGNRVGVGTETFSLSTTGKGRQLSQNVQSEMKGLFVDRGCKTANYWVLRKTKCPAALVEVGFIHNSQDNKVWDEQFENLAKAIARGLLKTVGKSLKDTSPVAPKPNGKMYRVSVDGKHIGSFGNIENVIKQVKGDYKKLNIEVI